MFTKILAALAAIGTILDLIKQAATWILAFIKDTQEKRRKDKLDKAVDKAKNAPTTEEKRNAACEIEKVFNPGSDCDSDSRK